MRAFRMPRRHPVTSLPAEPDPQTPPVDYVNTVGSDPDVEVAPDQSPAYDGEDS